MELIKNITAFVSSSPAYLQVLVIMGLALFTALVVLPFVAGGVRFLTRKTETDVDDQIISALNIPIFYVALLSGVSFSLPLLLSSESVLATSFSIIKTLFALAIAQALLRIIRILLQGASHTERIRLVSTQTLPLLNNLSFIVIGAGLLYAIFVVWGIDLTAWLAGAGIVGVAVGFAAKDTVANVISGIFILIDRPYSVGDFVELGSGTTGIVSDVGLRSTRIRTFNDEEVTVPNAVIANEEIINKTTGPNTGRVKVEIGVAYGSDVKKVEKILLECAQNHELVIEEPAPVVRFLNFGDSALNFALVCRVHEPLEVYVVKSDLHHAINIAFAEGNIEIPFPQRDVHMKN